MRVLLWCLGCLALALLGCDAAVVSERPPKPFHGDPRKEAIFLSSRARKLPDPVGLTLHEAKQAFGGDPIRTHLDNSGNGTAEWCFYRIITIDGKNWGRYSNLECTFASGKVVEAWYPPSSGQTFDLRQD